MGCGVGGGLEAIGGCEAPHPLEAGGLGQSFPAAGDTVEVEQRFSFFYIVD